MMKELIGFNLITFAITLFWILCYDMEKKDRLKLILGEPAIMGLLTLGVYLIP